MKIKKGDPVCVRLLNGEVLDAVYDGPTALEKCHHIKIWDALYLALGGKYARGGIRSVHECRFVGPAPIPVKTGEQQ